MCYYRWFVQAHSPVCSTLRIAQKRLTVFSCDAVRLGGGGEMVHVSGGTNY